MQGVGFRPFVYKLALELNLKGWVLNSTEGVTIHVEGDEPNLDDFINRVDIEAPVMARIDVKLVEDVHVKAYSDFFIQESYITTSKRTLIAPDVATCVDCSIEYNHKQDFRYKYPFINCTNCGPRFSIIKKLPYDRVNTSMENFKMCPKCAEEYQNPMDRRFHAQPNGCADCGPKIQVVNRDGNITKTSISTLLRQGNILAVKSIGGFLLVCNARDHVAVEKLRKRKQRDAKPFALMASDLQTVRKISYLSKAEEEQIVSPARPIVVLKQRENSDRVLPEGINPGLDTLGIMLPYAPLHFCFFEELDLLVATSANLSSNPLIKDNQEAMKSLNTLADYIVLHNRDIVNRCDDSVGAIVAGKWQFMRRARGYVPLPIELKEPVAPLLACGGDLKNSFCFAQDDHAILSQYLGDMENVKNYHIYCENINQLGNLTGIKPSGIIHDMHPGYHTTKFAKEYAQGNNIPIVAVQHHHAHMASCLAEHGIENKVLGIIVDGTGYGTDGAIWGCEFLYGDKREFQRLGHLEYVPLPGGDQSVKHPGRMSCSYLYSALGEEGISMAKSYLSKVLTPLEIEIIVKQINRSINAPETSSGGRLFDAVAAIVLGKEQGLYEGQAAMELEAASGVYNFEKLELQKMLDEIKGYRFQIEQNSNGFLLKSDYMWKQLLFDLDKKDTAKNISIKFHIGFTRGLVLAAQQMSANMNCKDVALSGGVFQNRLLTSLLVLELEQAGYNVYTNCKVPANDGGIALGQTVVGNEVIKNVFSSTP